jgi:hypothetical protein
MPALFRGGRAGPRFALPDWIAVGVGHPPRGLAAEARRAEPARRRVPARQAGRFPPPPSPLTSAVTLLPNHYAPRNRNLGSVKKSTLTRTPAQMESTKT